jgi:hypothetical protein
MLAMTMTTALVHHDADAALFELPPTISVSKEQSQVTKKE